MAKKCNAIDYCIDAVWTKQTMVSLKIENAICDDCKEWVGKAREIITQKGISDKIIKSLKWTCDLCPVKDVQNKCEKTVEDNVKEIFKLLESTLDPETVCSKLLFCNNAEYHQALIEYSTPKQELLPFTCSQCQHIGNIVQEKFDDSSPDDILEGMLGVCGELSSFSDACSSLVMTNFNDIYNKLQGSVKKDSICHMSGSCAQKFHKHEGIVDIIPDISDPAIPCQLCEQLVLHIRELLVANTTELEFKNVMIGFCHQMGKFSDECVQLTDEYYDYAYNFLADQLNASKACILIKICPTNSTSDHLRLPTMPLVSTELHPLPQQNSGANLVDVKMTFEDSSLKLYKNGSLCTVCEYLVHFVQEAMAKQSNEDKLIDLVKSSCMKLPTHIQGDCKEFVELYGDALVSLLDQNIKARYICPKIKLCPPNMSIADLQETAVDEKPTCPFCLMALQEIKDIIENNKTEQNIANVVSRLCDHLNAKLKTQCTEFVTKYSQEIVEMVLADFTPQEVCTYLKLCTDSEPKRKNVKIVVEQKVENTPQCVLCKEVIKLVEQRVINKKSKDEIRRELENSCGRLKKFSGKCKEFVDKYSDRIVDLLEEELTPEQLCRELIFCVAADDRDSQDYDSGLDVLMMALPTEESEISSEPQCVICEFVMTKLDKALKDKKTDDEIKRVIKNICSEMPSTVNKSCNQFVDYYFDMIIVLIETTKPSEMCAELKLCPQIFEVTMPDVQRDIIGCAVCRGLVESMDTIIEDPDVDTNLENLEQKACEKFAGKYKVKVC